MAEPLTSDADRLKRLEADFEARYRYQPKLPSSALFSGALAMACGFGAVMFFMFAYANGFQRWVPQMLVFGALSLLFGLANRLFARRWFAKVRVWSSERAQLLDEIEHLKKGAPGRTPGGA
ncbi:MAG: hypothetical protein KIS92_17875 [Planctomycetota bacterium]|nr:hypothetical protein [Planctomycetota bacterium]